MPLSQKHYLFQVNQHVQTSIMLLSIMDSAELDINNTLLPSSSITTTSNPDDYEKGLLLNETFFSKFSYNHRSSISC